ncbi:MAG: hypothetical protein J3K34DRAFT_491622 [Monoraphidium minutum]|nr:MAG: hypothetical protein J3K34DRAFT_491622 [Monoraphidium minutum]
MLSAAWELRTRRTATGAQFAPADVCRDFVGTVRRLVRADWLRATADITDLPGVQASWFPAEERRQPFTVADFERRWCPGSVVAHVVHGQAGRPARVDLRLGAPSGLDLAGWSLETLLHALLDCPAVRPALRWLADLWPRFSGGGAPPLTAAVWLQDSPAAWRPHAAQAGAEARAHAEQRWAYLRLAVLEAAWRLRCRRRRGGQQFEAADVVDDVIEGIERRVLADWQRTSPAMLVAAGTCPSWFPRRRRPMDRAQFEALWCAGGARAAAAACDLGPSAGAYWVYVRRRAAGGGLAAAGGGLAAAAGGGSAAAAAATSAAATAAAALPANAGGSCV